MRTGRVEAFSDGVLAIIITIMVLELRVPEGHHLSDLFRTAGVGLLTYLLTFIYVGIYWNNHHHLFHLVQRVSGGVLWANLGLLFALSLFPFTTAWVDDSRFERTPVVIYGLNLLCAAVAHLVLLKVITRREGPESLLRRAIGKDLKGKISPAVYLAGMVSALTIDRDGKIGVWVALAWYVAAAIIWIVPDPRIGRAVEEYGTPD
ncbi:TMEM175 family protein [Micromonospora sp. URMC 103]|uniref:TMEM175 family protein n=1 Tax=Micromonospora sp. URMC 103 TaxID=3423406 RepID=UPI003F1B9C65